MECIGYGIMVATYAMSFALIRTSRSIFIGNLGLFWIYFFGHMVKVTADHATQLPAALAVSKRTFDTAAAAAGE
jgi:hypothetical protein